jgi:cytochrome oxidase Cu insertion factor (SCO1/SenC/PrrC family)
MPKGLVFAIGAMAVILFLGSAAVLIIAAQRVGPGEQAKTDGGLVFGPSSAKSGATGDPLAPDPQLSDIALLPFELTDQNGNTVTNAALSGKITVVDFIFTHCPLVCPTLSGQMAGVAAKISDPRVQFLSVSVDPERDTPERLKDYAASLGGDQRWRFLRGSKEQTWKLVREGMKFGISEDESMPIKLGDGSTMFNIRHPAHLVLVGPKGEVLGMYLGTRDEEVGALVDRVQRALKKM